MRIGGLVGPAAAAVAFCAGPPSQAQPLPELTLVCPGQESRMDLDLTSRGRMKMSGMGMSKAGRRGDMGGMMRPAPRPRQLKFKAQINVVLEGEGARIWLSEGLLSSLRRKSDDGWYALSELHVDATAIRGKAPFGVPMGRTALTIDRTNGKVTLGDFEGVCHPAMLGPEVTTF